MSEWLERQRMNVTALDSMIKYKLECGDALLDKGANRLQILECIKDAYGMPYIPGSSLKGMFRTILLGADIISNSDKYQNQRKNMYQNSNMNASRLSYLKKDIKDIESAAFRTLNRPESRPKDAVNDILQGLIISDSEPLSTDVLCYAKRLTYILTEEKKRYQY